MCQKMMSLLHRVEDTDLSEQPDPFIDHTFIINLDTRRDRWDSLLASEPNLNRVTKVIERIPAVNGRTLQMNSTIYNLFKDNIFKWKKAVIGCALSHLSIWNLVAQEKEGLYLVLEDDVRFQKDWQRLLRNAFKHIPKDADVLYLGGVLPPNKPELSSVLQSVNEHWAYIKPNTLFTPIPLPIFHFCNYSYMLTPAGAQKLVSFASKYKIHIPCDHFMGNPSFGLHIYVSQPLLSFCFQEENPVYAQAAFNNLHETTDFDSDIYNNTECFSNEELTLFNESEKAKNAKKVIFHIPTDDGNPYDIYEGVWLEDMMKVKLQLFALMPETVIEHNSLFLVQRPYLQHYNHLFAQLNQRNIPFHILHLSDEFSQDDITFYSLPMCKSVVRNYLRNDLPDLPHIHVIPLGYHHKPTATNKSWEDRELMWSFHGTDWFDRSKHLQPLGIFVPHSCHLQPDWNHSTATKPQQYLNHLSNSKFCPILRGNNDETFRLYEALEAGCLPVTTITNASYLNWVDKHLGLSSLYQWTNPVATMQSNTITESLRLEVGKRWLNWKQHIQMLLH